LHTPSLPPQSPLFPYTTLFRSNSASTRAPVMSATTSGASRGMSTKYGGAFTYVDSPSHANRSPSGTGSAAQRSSPVNTSAYSSRSEEHTSELQSRENLVCRLLL